jgi:hypothetical protein
MCPSVAAVLVLRLPHAGHLVDDPVIAYAETLKAEISF